MIFIKVSSRKGLFRCLTPLTRSPLASFGCPVISTVSMPRSWRRVLSSSEAVRSYRVSDPCGQASRNRYRERNLTERMFGRLKDYRRVATRYDKLGRRFLAGTLLAAILIRWLN